MMSFRTLFDAKRAHGIRATFGFQFPSDGFVATVNDGRFENARSDPSPAAVILVCEPTTLASLVHGGLPVGDAENSGLLSIGGDRALAKRLPSLFVLPKKVDLPAR